MARDLTRRVGKLEQARKPPTSAVIMFASTADPIAKEAALPDTVRRVIYLPKKCETAEEWLALFEDKEEQEAYHRYCMELLGIDEIPLPMTAGECR